MLYILLDSFRGPDTLCLTVQHNQQTETADMIKFIETLETVAFTAFVLVATSMMIAIPFVYARVLIG